jgi:hypothetical protein
MALTKVTTGVVKDVVNSSSTITVRSIDSIGIITASSFVGSGASFSSVVTATSFVGSGAGLTGITGGASQVYDSTVFAYQNVVESDITVALPYKTATIYTDPDVTVDIESGVQMSINDGCVLNIIDI